MKNKIIEVLKTKGLRQNALLDVLNVSTRQALSNKVVADRWTLEDLRNVCSLTGYRLAFIDENNTIIQDITEQD